MDMCAFIVCRVQESGSIGWCWWSIRGSELGATQLCLDLVCQHRYLNT